MKFRAQKRNGSLEINWDHLDTYASRWKDGTHFDVEIVRREKKIPDPLRKYYFAAVLPPFMAHLGYDPDEEELFHRQLKIVYFKISPDAKGIYRKVPSVFGNESELPISKKQEFVEWVCRKAAQDGVYIESPGGDSV